MSVDLFKRHLIGEPDKLIATTFAGIGLLGLMLTLLGRKSFIIEASMVTFPSILYLVLGRKKEKTHLTNYHTTTFTLVFLGLLGVGVLAYLYLPSDVTLGLSIISLSGSITLVQICLMGSARVHGDRALILIETLVLSLSLRLLPSLSNPGFPGIDPWTLSTTSVEILRTGHVTRYSVYGNFPIYNILISMGSIATCIDVRSSTLLLVGFAEAFSIFFVYLAAKAAWNHSAGLTASLLYALTPSSIYWGTYPIPMTIGITLTIFLVSLLFQSDRSRDLRLPYRALASLIVMVIVLTHSLTSVVVIVILVAMVLSTYLLKLRDRVLSSKGILDIPKFNAIMILTFVLTLTHWVYVATDFFSATTVTLSSILDVYYPEEFIMQSYVVPVSLIKVFFEDFGLITLYSVALMGLFLALSRGEAKNAFIILTVTGAIYGVSVLLPLTGIISRGMILADRWEPFLFVFLVCLSARALQYIRDLFSIRAAIALFAIIGVLMIPSIISYSPQNLDRHFSPIYFLSSELTAADWAKGHLSSQDIASDSRYAVVLGREAKDFGRMIISGSVTHVAESLPNTALLVSTYSFQGGRIIIERARKTFGKIGVALKLPYNLDSFLDSPYYNRFFSNGVVNSYG